MKSYALYIVAFVAAIYANMQALAHSNVETVIVFRACSPIAVSIVEYLFMDRAWPSLRSSISLCTVAFGAILYCQSDSQLALNGIGACMESYLFPSPYPSPFRSLTNYASFHTNPFLRVVVFYRHLGHIVFLFDHL